MKNKIFMGFLALILVAVGVVAVNEVPQSEVAKTDEAVTLRFRPEVGAAYEQKNSFKTKMEMASFMGDMKFGIDGTANVESKVESVDNDGIVLISQTFKDLKMNLEGLEDVIAPGFEAPDLSVISRILADLSLNVRMDSTGHIVEILDLDKFMQTAMSRMSQEIPEMEMGGNETQQMLEQVDFERFTGVTTIFPDRPVRIGDSWSVTIPSKQLGMGQGEVNFDKLWATLVDRQAGIASIEIVGTLHDQNQIPLGEEADAPVMNTKSEAELSLYVEMDEATGFILKQRMDMKMHSNSVPSDESMQAMSTSMDMLMNADMTATRI